MRMRRSDRQIKEFTEILAVIRKCEVCRIAFHDEEYPYIVPLNFGLEIEEDQIILYFHGALQGKKYQLIEKSPQVCFEMDCSHRLVTDETKQMCTMEYESIIGYGTIEEVPEEEKLKGLQIIMQQYPEHKDFKFNTKMIPATRVFRLRTKSLSGKRRMV